MGKKKSSRENSQNRTILSRSTSPDPKQVELRQRYEEQEAKLKELRKAQEQECKKEDNAFKSHQAELREKYEQQERLKKKCSRETSRERSSSSLPRCISPDSDQIELRRRYIEQKQEASNRKRESKVKQKLQKEADRREQAKLKEKFEDNLTQAKRDQRSLSKDRSRNTTPVKAHQQELKDRYNKELEADKEKVIRSKEHLCLEQQELRARYVQQEQAEKARSREQSRSASASRYGLSANQAELKRRYEEQKEAERRKAIAEKEKYTQMHERYKIQEQKKKQKSRE